MKIFKTRHPTYPNVYTDRMGQIQTIIHALEQVEKLVLDYVRYDKQADITNYIPDMTADLHHRYTQLEELSNEAF